ncbi:glycosyltransferase family 2 protein [bacterium]|nr:glycosyltransferase family 2 protein [bacterium]
MESRPKTKNRFAFVIPVYNHENMIGTVIKQALLLNYPVIVVDDGSTDRTPDILKEFDNITVIRHKRNLGKGAALKSGFKEASKFADWAISVDADGQHNVNDASVLIKAALNKGRCLVIGKREGMHQENVPWTSRFGKNFSNFWVFASGGPWLSDTQSGFRIYPLPEITHLKTVGSRYQYEVEILAKANWMSILIIEAPVSVDYMPGDKRISHFKPFPDFMRNSWTFIRLILQRAFIPLPLRKRIFSI